MVTAHSKFARKYFSSCTPSTRKLINVFYLVSMDCLLIRNSKSTPGVGNLPSTILFDFEAAATNAFSGIFPNRDICWCFFHLSSNIYKRIQVLGLQEQSINDVEFALHLFLSSFVTSSETHMVQTLMLF